MYWNRTKHKILKYYMDEITRAEVKVPPPKILLTKYAKSIEGVNENVAATLLMDMMYEGYFTFYNVPPPQHDQLIEITNHGIATFIGERLLRKNSDIFWKGAMNIFITLANIAVAVTAIWALTKEPAGLQKLEERLRKIELVPTQDKGTTSPNMGQKQNFGQPTTKTSLIKNPVFYLDTFYIGVDTIYK